VNDSLGHKVGDQILQFVVQRLRDIRWENTVVGRIGGDEFAFIVENYGDKDQLRALATSLLQTFARPFVIPESTIHLSVSIGISVCPEDGSDEETLIRNAGIAMDYIKSNMGDNFSFYTKQFSETIARKLYFETEIRKAVVNNEFTLHYQPQIHLNTGEVMGVEALIRWNHPTLGFISPAEFIPVAEETGLINLVGKWVLKTACEQHQIWRDVGFSVGRMAVNVSIHQFQTEDFYETVCEVLKETEMNPQFLELEITESVVKNVKQLSDVLFRLRRLGVKIAVDDFGTGYSSLNLLHSLPLDTLKIDRSFIAELCNPSSQSLVKTMIDIGRNLNFDVIAEGMETEEQILFLRDAACPIAQGFYYSKPLPAGEIRKRFEKSEVNGF
jgi:diguanylate cyclase (GGDEF)-like protein